MDRPETLSLLRGAHDEIVMLRRRVEELEPKAQAYEHISTILGIIPQGNSREYGVDIAWRIESEVEAIIAEREAERDQPPAALNQEPIETGGREPNVR